MGWNLVNTLPPCSGSSWPTSFSPHEAQVGPAPARGLHQPNWHPPSLWRWSWARDAVGKSLLSNLQWKRPRILTENRVELEFAPITSIIMETHIKRNQSGWISFTQSSNPRHRPLPSPRRYPLLGAKSTALGALSKTDAPFGAFIIAGGAPEITDIDAKLGPNYLANTIRHCCPLSSQGEQNRFAMSPRCRRWKFHWKPRPEAPYTANSGEPSLRAGHAAPWPELPLAARSSISALD
jgi:hypothetical protein